MAEPGGGLRRSRDLLARCGFTVVIAAVLV